MTLAAIYTRYSSTNQDRASTIRQLDDCRKYAKEHGWEVVGEYIDEETTGRSDQREAFLRLIEDGQAKRFGAVIVWALDRFARNRDDSRVYKVTLRRAGVLVHSVTEPIDHDTDEGVIRESIAELFGELESRKIGRRVRSGMISAAKRGFYPSYNCLYGFRRVRVADQETGRERWQLEPDPAAAEVVQRIFREYIDGSGLKAIANSLNRDQVPTQRGARGWMMTTVGAILKNPGYRGTLVWGKRKTGRTPERETAQFKIEPLIDERTWKKAQARRRATSHPTGRKTGSSPRPFSGLCRCGICGDQFRALSKAEGKYSMGCVRRYRFGGPPDGCGNRRYIREDVLMGLVRRDLDILLDPTRLKRAIAVRVGAARTKKADSTKERDLGRRLADVEARLRRLWDAVENGTMPAAEARKRINDRESERNRLRDELQALERKPEEDPRDFLALAEEAMRVLETATGSDFRRILAAIGASIFIHPERIEVVIDAI